jgi:hypothetical protein
VALRIKFTEKNKLNKTIQWGKGEKADIYNNKNQLRFT